MNEPNAEIHLVWKPMTPQTLCKTLTKRWSFQKLQNSIRKRNRGWCPTQSKIIFSKWEACLLLKNPTTTNSQILSSLCPGIKSKPCCQLMMLENHYIQNVRAYQTTTTSPHLQATYSQLPDRLLVIPFTGTSRNLLDSKKLRYPNSISAIRTKEG